MSDLSTKKILVLGGRWSGKTLLIKRLEDLCTSNKHNHDEFLSTTPTLGKTLTLIQYKRHQKLEIHELGATLACLWKSFYISNHFEKILYVIDVTQPWSMACVFEQLKEIYEQTTIPSKQILFVLNKVNELNSLNRIALNELLDFNSLWDGEVEIVDVNARTGSNLISVIDWLIRQ